MEHSSDNARIFLGTALQWAKANFGSNDLAEKGLAQRILGLYSKNFALDSAIRALSAKNIPVPADLGQKIAQNNSVIASFLLEVFPGIESSRIPKKPVLKKGDLLKLGSIISETEGLSKNAVAVTTVIRRLPLKRKGRDQLPHNTRPRP